jgi:hypothetical protein
LQNSVVAIPKLGQLYEVSIDFLDEAFNEKSHFLLLRCAKILPHQCTVLKTFGEDLPEPPVRGKGEVGDKGKG